MNDTIKAPKETIEKVLNYIATKPYFEVASLISELQQAIQESIQPQIRAIPKSQEHGKDE